MIILKTLNICYNGNRCIRMKKLVLGFLVILTLFLSGFLIYNINNLNELKDDNSLLLKEIQEYENSINETNLTKNNYEQELENVKNNSKDKINVYEMWNKWIREIEQRMS